MIKGVIFDMYETLVTHYSGYPVYFSEAMARDSYVDADAFKAIWQGSKKARSIGRLSFEKVISEILISNNKFSHDVANKIMYKRKMFNEFTCKNVNKSVLHMLETIKSKDIKLGLISNCFSDEVDSIECSPVYSFFDDVRLSYLERVCKPEKDIFMRCLGSLGLEANECMYVSDGDCKELEAASVIGLRTIQATWFCKNNILCEDYGNRFIQVNDPMKIVFYVDQWKGTV